MENLIKACSPLFIVGNPRSGTSLLRLILTSHSEVLIPPECGFMVWLKNKYGDWQRSDSNDQARLSDFLVDLFASKKFDTWGLDRKKIESQIVTIQPRNYAELCSTIYASYGFSIGRHFSMWGDKNNFHINHLRDILGLYKHARFLHIVRDGRDVACSYREVMAKKSNSPYAPKLNTDITDIAMEWANNVMKADLFMSTLPENQTLTIKYEDLVMTSLETTGAICEWLGFQFEPEMLNFYKQNRKKKLEPELTMDWKKRTMLPISDETVGRYKNILSSQELNLFESVASHALDKFGYE